MTLISYFSSLGPHGILKIGAWVFLSALFIIALMQFAWRLGCEYNSNTEWNYVNFNSERMWKKIRYITKSIGMVMAMMVGFVAVCYSLLLVFGLA